MYTRLAISEDSRRIVEFRNVFRDHASRQHINSNRELTEKDVERMQEMIASPDKVIYIAEDDSKLVWLLSGSIWRHKFSHRIEAGLVIDPSYQRAGVGSMLLKEFEMYVKSLWIVRIDFKISQENAPSIAFAEKHGYVLEGKEEKGIQKNNGWYTDLLSYGKIV